MTPDHSSLPASAFEGYTYAYPHKTAYRPLEPKPLLADVWRDEDKQSLFLYVHVPFCEMRCGFCNLFTYVRPRSSEAEDWLSALRRDAAQVDRALGDSRRFVRFALGGGTPTQLRTELLEDVLRIVSDLGARLEEIPAGAETSPETASKEKLQLLREHGVDRISIGVQSFLTAELSALGRPQREVDVEAALHTIRELGFPTLNVDLIYGMSGQTPASLKHSLDRAMAFAPEELYLYPLYVRPVTGLGRRGVAAFDDQRLMLYRAGREHLLERGYRQVSMRMFRRAGVDDAEGPAYCCQQDGMVGLGPGARSYTRALHYSSDYAVAQAEVREIVQHYARRTDDDFSRAQVGFHLNDDEQMRRFVVHSLLSDEGLSRPAFTARFGQDPVGTFPHLQALVEEGWGQLTDEALRLTPAGLERSDGIGPWLYSEQVRARMAEYEAR